ncbi:MAG TPA: LysR family transcriptional regulator [Phenylobacterium sp.]|nr:LysR family transcriptional regulator [Phenylobacterium sp.]
MFDWNDLRTFLAVARGGSTLAAAKALGINQTTAARRIEALEQAVGLKLFERGQAGSRLTEAGLALIIEAEAVERAAEGFAHQARSLQRGMSGTLRVTINEAMANAFLAPALADFRRLYPDIKVEMVVSDAFLDLAKGEADVAIRGSGGLTLADSDLISRKLSDVNWGLYCSPDYAIQHGFPTTPEEINDHLLIGGEGALAHLPALKWMAEKAPRGRVHTRSSTLTNLAVSVKAGLGVAPLPMLICNHDPDMHLCLEIDELPTTVFTVWRPEMKDVPRVRAFIDFLTPHFVGVRKAFQDKGRLVQEENRRAVLEARARIAAEART